ncbi:MAG: S9 family peptidase [Anaerolineaceae bacterium]|nr:S9 family peptidase [Anaerolineaceae bacterium]
MSELRPIQPEDLFRQSFLQSAALSPDGRWLAYAVSTTDEASDSDRSAIWLQDMDSGAERQLTSGQAVDNEPAFSPDGREIAFISTRSGSATGSSAAQLYVISRDGGEARQLTDLAQGVGSGPAWSPDGQTITFTAGPDHGDEPPDWDHQPYRVTRPIYRFDAIGYLDPVLQDVFVIAADGSGEAQRLTQDASMNSALRWSPDGRSILYQAHFEGGMWHRFGFAGLRIVDLAGETRTLLSDWGVISLADWLPSGDGLAFVGIPEGVDIGTNADLWTISLAEGAEPVNRSTSLTGNVGGGLQPDFPSKLLWEGGMQIDASGEVAYVQVQDRGEVQLYRVALSGAEDCQAIVAGERSCYILGQSAPGPGTATGRLLFSSSTIHRPPELCSCDTEGGDERQHSQLYDDFYAEIAQGGVRHLQFSGTDGEPAEGWLLLPPAGEAPHPLVLYIHGGPHGAFGHIYHFDMQMLAGAGYAVLLVNHRASSGYGDEFGTAIKGDWGNLDYGDLMAGVDEAIAQGLVDPERMGVCGLSGGGNLSSWIVGQTDRFKAAVPENPVTNWLSFYGVSDIGTYFSVEELGGTPWEIPEIYRRCSPITNAHRCTTPTLLVQCEHDWRCPAEQSEQFYAVLKAVGCPVEMLRIPRASHAGAINGAPAMRRVQNDALLDWMDHYVLGKPRREGIV